MKVHTKLEWNQSKLKHPTLLWLLLPVDHSWQAWLEGSSTAAPSWQPQPCSCHLMHVGGFVAPVQNVTDCSGTVQAMGCRSQGTALAMSSLQPGTFYKRSFSITWRATQACSNLQQSQPQKSWEKKVIPIHTWLLWQEPSYANLFTSQNSSVGWDFVDSTVEECSTRIQSHSRSFYTAWAMTM